MSLSSLSELELLKIYISENFSNLQSVVIESTANSIKYSMKFDTRAHKAKFCTDLSSGVLNPVDIFSFTGRFPLNIYCTNTDNDSKIPEITSSPNYLFIKNALNQQINGVQMLGSNVTIPFSNSTKLFTVYGNRAMFIRNVTRQDIMYQPSIPRQIFVNMPLSENNVQLHQVSVNIRINHPLIKVSDNVIQTSKYIRNNTKLHYLDNIANVGGASDVLIVPYHMAVSELILDPINSFYELVGGLTPSHKITHEFRFV